MADQDRTFSPSQTEVNRGRMQGLGVGQKELNAQRDADRAAYATDPERTEPFDTELEVGPAIEDEPPEDEAPEQGALKGGAPEDDWGESADEGALHGENHTRRPIKTEAERGQGAKTRQMNKDIVSRRT